MRAPCRAALTAALLAGSAWTATAWTAPAWTVTAWTVTAWTVTAWTVTAWAATGVAPAAHLAELGEAAPAPVPEPASLAMVGAALAGLGLWRRRPPLRRPDLWTGRTGTPSHSRRPAQPPGPGPACSAVPCVTKDAACT